MSGPIQREFRVAFSRKVQPIWFRILKWVLIVATFILFRHQPHFWFWVLGVAVLAVALHLFLSLENSRLDARLGRME